MDHPKTTVGIFGEDPLTSRILGLMLVGVGYEVRVLDSAVLEEPSASLAGVSLMLLMPWLGDERKEDLLMAMNRDPATAAVPVLNLSTVLKEEPDEQTDSVPWPWSVTSLVRAIEAVLVPAPSGEV